MPLPERTFAGSIHLPDGVMQLQARIERLYISQKALEQEVRTLRARRPVLCTLPRRPVLIWRLALRLLRPLRHRYQARVIRDSGLFDHGWYLATYPDVAASGSDPVVHFLAHGAAERRDPGPHFDTDHYLRMYPDIAGNGMNPLLHYLQAGWAEGRSIHPDMPHEGDR